MVHALHVSSRSLLELACTILILYGTRTIQSYFAGKSAHGSDFSMVHILSSRALLELARTIMIFFGTLNIQSCFAGKSAHNSVFFLWYTYVGVIGTKWP